MRRAGILLLAILTASMSGCVFTVRSSVSTSGAQADGRSRWPSVSGDGRYVAFGSSATNLVSGDTNGTSDVFVRDHQSGETERVNVDSSGVQANIGSGIPFISADGRYVAFVSSATNLVPDDTNGKSDVFVHDRTTGATERVSVDSAGTQGNNHSSDGGRMSSDGRYISFGSQASNLVAGDTNGQQDTFVHDRNLGVTERVSVDSAGAQANGSSLDGLFSSDGRYVAFSSQASNLVASDTNGARDVFLHDRMTSTTERISVNSSEAQAESGSSSDPGGISSNGRNVSFWSSASNLVSGDTNGPFTFDVFVRDRTTGTTQMVSVDSAGTQGNNDSYFAGLSADGRYVAFVSEATNLVSDDTNGFEDFFVHDRTTANTQRVSLGVRYQQTNAGYPDLLSPPTMSFSADGRYVAFDSNATNLIRNDTNGVSDVYLRFALAPRPLATIGPSSIPRGTTGQVTLTSAWLDPSFLQIWVGPAQGITIDQIEVQSPNTTAVLTITVAADAQTGSRDLFVFNPGNDWNSSAGGGDSCVGCLTVT